MSKVVALYISESASVPMLETQQVELEAGKGVVGDRYYSGKGTFSEKLAGLPDVELTLIESEEVDLFNKEYGHSFSAGDFRRNIVTEGVRLNDLEGKEFQIGDVRLRGVRLCEPCAHLAGILTSDIMPAMVHKTGLRAQIVSGGAVTVGEAVQ
jgi:MOSC domain-containing protein YiiM